MISDNVALFVDNATAESTLAAADGNGNVSSRLLHTPVAQLDSYT